MELKRLKLASCFIKEFAEEFIVLKADYLNCNNHSFKDDDNCISDNHNQSTANDAAPFCHHMNYKSKNGVSKGKGAYTDKAD